jgi:hypothetical protein
MYKLTDKEYDIKKVISPKILKGLKELGLYSPNLTGDQESENLFDLFIDEEKFKKFLDTIFIIEGEVDFNSVNIVEALRGYKDFFLQLKTSLS